jgi:UDP-N-acetylmuramate--alanine ligase
MVRDTRSGAVVAVRGFDLGEPRRVHVVAVGGYAMSAIARYLHQLGHSVSGCDITDAPVLATLAGDGIEVELGHDADHVTRSTARLDALSVATAVPRNLPELLAAAERGIPVLSRGETMRLIAATKPNVAVVSGTHGKTTTSAMVTSILRAAGHCPSFFVGGTITELGTNAGYDHDGEWLVVEGDESDHSFLDFPRNAALVTNIEADHLDRWGDDIANLVWGFETFIDTTERLAVLCVDDPVTRALADARPNARTYGFAPTAHVHARDYTPTPTGSRVTIECGGDEVDVDLRLRGRDMAQNAVGAFALTTALEVAPQVAAEALAGFSGVARRFQFRGTCNGADCFDDYAHTATEVRTTLARAREGGWARVIAVFQPHRYTRIARHAAEFGEAFDAADLVVVTGLDAAFEAPIEGVSDQLVVQAIHESRPGLAVVSIPEWDDLATVPWEHARAGDCIVTLGCGTITKVHDDWARIASAR